MDAKTIERWIMNLGRPYETLVAEGVIPDQPLTELYKGRDWLTLKPGNGLELSFWAETKRFERLFITLLATVEGTTEYKGELPKPFAPVMSQSGVRATFGEPMESQGLTKLPLNTMVGGFDTYRLDPATHPNMKVSFQYTTTMQVKTLVFSLIDRGHD
ncbi:DUF6392 family protein [Zestomonas carbonaria]|uniref:Pyocin immunity protein n=1 Tax=Zestomonas carbonaria TaxID=2762745 RepID=A0A7U7EJ71_9GAMM|nr:DUF6392 family protein [Pseudomonas carbonaria]CAD5105960.1 hypothetical protein PSEWESI4_00219 [Pseudomonas carbonaria]